MSAVPPLGRTGPIGPEGIVAFGTLRRVLEFGVGLIVGASVAALVMIVVGPSRKVRADGPLPPDVEAAVLLGRTPDESAPAVGPEHPRQYTDAELAELRRLGSERRKRR